MKNAALLFVLFLTFNLQASNTLKKELIPIKVTMNDGQVKTGKVNNKFDPEKKITLIHTDDSEESLASEDVKEFTLSTAQGELTYENVRYYKNAKRTDIASKPMFMMVMVRAPSPLSMYYQVPWQTAIGENAAASMYNTINFYAQREGEPAATLLSSVMQGQVNPNSVFKNSAPDYFADYPELAKKIENKTYTYAEIMTVAMEYIKWKVGPENFKENKK